MVRMDRTDASCRANTVYVKKGCSPDNAACEGFFGRLKNEMFYGRSWIGVTMDDFINELNSYINWYNTKRIKIHSIKKRGGLLRADNCSSGR